MRAMWKGFISFGLVTIPVSLGVAQQKRDVSFRTLSRETGQPVKQKRWDPDADREVTADEVVKGYEVAKGRYVTVEDDELERFGARQEKTIEILQFVDLPEVDPVYYERAYWIEPQERAERPYALLREAMERSGRAAVGRFVLSTKEHLVLIRPHDEGLTLETLYWPEDIRIADHREISERLAGVEVKEQELAMAEQLIAGLTQPFDAERYANQTRAALLDFLEAKADGQEPVIGEAPDEPAPVIDLMAALKASLAAAGGDAPDDAGEDDEADQAAGAKGRLRKVPGGKKAGPKEAAAPKRRTRKAS